MHFACIATAVHNTVISAPFSLGSHPQKRPQLMSAHIPPSIVPPNVNINAKHNTAYTVFAVSPVSAPKFPRENIFDTSLACAINPAKNIPQYPTIIVTTCAVSQKLEFNTALIIPIVSPLYGKFIATNSDISPHILAATPTERYFFFKYMYTPIPAATAPVNTSDEYRFVTGGRICMYILKIIPNI